MDRPKGIQAGILAGIQAGHAPGCDEAHHSQWLTAQVAAEVACAQVHRLTLLAIQRLRQACNRSELLLKVSSHQHHVIWLRY